MAWLTPLASGIDVTATVVQLALLFVAAWTDLSTRLIPNAICVGLGVAGAMTRLLIGPLALTESIAVAAAVFLLLLLLHMKQMLGGGDVKLLVAVALGQSFADALRVVFVTALAGGVLAVAHLAMRRLPRPRLAPVCAGVLRRVYVAERWRVLRHAPLPYGMAIACGGVWALLVHTGN